jgi:hypothetical protein
MVHRGLTQQEGLPMKTLLACVLLALSLVLLGGCATPGYSGGWPTIQPVPDVANGAHMNRLVRNVLLDEAQIVDDIDYVMLLDPASRLSKWNVR